MTLSRKRIDINYQTMKLSRLKLHDVLHVIVDWTGLVIKTHKNLALRTTRNFVWPWEVSTNDRITIDKYNGIKRGWEASIYIFRTNLNTEQRTIHRMEGERWILQSC
jgi:hypothetical protein